MGKHEAFPVMKLNFDVQPGPKLFPYTYGEKLARAVYRRLDLEDHEGLSVHSVSWLWGDAEATSRGLVLSGLQSWSVGLREEDARRPVEDLQSSSAEIASQLTMRESRPPAALSATTSKIISARMDYRKAFLA